MRIRLLSVLLIGAVFVTVLSGCIEVPAPGSETDTDTGEITGPEHGIVIDPDEKSIDDPDFDYDSHIVLPDYRSFSVKVQEKIDFTAEDADEVIDSILASSGYVVKDEELDTVNYGQVVSIDFDSMIDGEEYSGGSQSDFCLVVGSGSFIPELEQSLVGRKVGDEFEISASYPADYSVGTLAGKKADFSVTVNYIGHLMEATDELIEEFSDGQYETVDQFRSYLVEYNSAVNSLIYEENLYSKIWDLLHDQSEIKAVPTVDRVRYCDSLVDYYTAYAEANKATYAEFTEAQGYTEEEFYDYLYSELSLEAIERKLILSAVAKKEGVSFDLSNEERDELLKGYYSYYNAGSFLEFSSMVGALSAQDLCDYCLIMKKIASFIDITVSD